MKFLAFIKTTVHVLSLKFPSQSAFLLVGFICTFTTLGLGNTFYKDMGSVSLKSGDTVVLGQTIKTLLNYQTNGWAELTGFYKQNFKKVVIKQKDLFVYNLNKTFSLTNDFTGINQNLTALNSTKQSDDSLNSFGQVLAATNIVEQSAVKTVQPVNSFETNLASYVERILNKYISEGRIITPAPQVIVIPSYPPKDYFQSAPVVTYVSSPSSSNNVLGSVAGFTYLSSEEFISQKGLFKKSLEVTGNSVFSGTVTANAFVGDGSQLTGISGGSGQWLTVTSTPDIYFSAGKIGVGTSSPSQTLSVAGGMRLTGALFDANNASGTLGMILQTTGTGTQWVATSSLGISGSGTTLATGTVTRMNIKNLSIPPYKYNSFPISSTTLSGVSNIQSSFFDGNYMWFGTDTSPAKLVRVNPINNQTTTYTLESGEDSVFAMTTDGTYLYASTLTFPSKIIKIDPNTGSRVDTYTLTSPADRIMNMIYDGRYIWGVTYTSPAAVIKLDPTDGSFVSYPMSSGDNSAWALVSDGQNLWISTDTSPAKIFKFNMSSGTYTSMTLSSPNVQYVNGGVFDGTNVWFSSGDSAAKLIKVNPQTDRLQIFNMNSGENYGAALTFDGQNLWMSIKNGAFGRLLKIDPQSPYSHTTYNLDSVNVGMTNVAFDGVNIWAGTYSNPAVVYRVPYANGNASYASAGYFDFTPTTTSPTLLIQPSDTSNWSNASTTYLGVNATSTFSGNLIDLQISGTTQFRVTSQGRVGINSSTPSASLTVRGTGSTTPFIVTSSTGATILIANFNNRVGIGTSSPVASLSVHGSSAFGTVNPFVVASSSGSQILTVTNTGKIGINSSNPGSIGLTSAALEIADSTGTNSDLQLRVSGNNQASVAFLSTGGTLTTPTTSTANTILGILEFNGYDGITHRRGASITSRVEATPASGVFSGNLIFNTNSSSTAVTERMRLTSIGYLGIGTTGPVSTLSVVGTTTSVSFNSNNATSSYQINGLNVLRTPNTTNLLLGINAGFSNSTGTNNTFVGYESGYLNTGGSGNTLVGRDAGYQMTTGNRNTFVGLSAGNWIGSGSDNVFMGYYSGVDIAGDYNIAIGSNYDLGLSSRSSTIAIGYYAKTTANNQMVIGSSFASGTISSVYIGQGVSKATPEGVILYATGGSGTNNAGGNFGISAGRGTGNVSSGNILFITSDPLSSGSTAQPTSTKAVITSTGRFGVGTTSPIATLAVMGTSSAPTINPFVVASSSGTQLLTVLANGNVGIGTSSPSAPLEVRGSGTGATIAKFTDNNSTGCTLATGGTISCSSDARLKKNIGDINYGLNAVMSLRPVEYNWNYEDDLVAKSLGFIAQEVEQVVPKLVNQDSTGQYQLNTTGVIPILTKAIQQQQETINQLQQTINNLQNSGNDLNPLATTIKVQLYLSEDSVGEARILAGHNLVRVTFKNPYQYKPIVTIASVDTFAPAYVTYIDHEGFTIKLDEAFVAAGNSGEYKFAWHSFASKDAIVFVSDGNNTLVNIEVVGSNHTSEINESTNNEPESQTVPTEPESSLPEPEVVTEQLPEVLGEQVIIP